MGKVGQLVEGRRQDVVAKSAVNSFSDIANGCVYDWFLSVKRVTSSEQVATNCS
jgi:hypothetical protein